MDYLITNGYPAAAKKFAAEANIQPKMDVESIQERVDIRSAIHSGDIKTAIEKLNELNPQVAPTPVVSFFFFFFFFFWVIYESCYDYTSFMHHS